MVVLISFITLFYKVSVGPKGTVILVDREETNKEKITLQNNKPRTSKVVIEEAQPNEIVESKKGDNNQMKNVIDEPQEMPVEINNKGDTEQVAEPPKSVITFPGKFFIWINQL